MNVSSFISISSAVLLTWLGVTYFHQVPHDRYPKQNRQSADTDKVVPKVKESTIAVSVIE